MKWISWDSSSQSKESLPPTHPIPIPTLASPPPLGEHGKIWPNKNGVCKFVCTFNLLNWKGRKLHRNIKILREFVIFLFPLWKRRTVFIFMSLGLMEITRNPLSPSVWCRGCPQQGFPPPKNGQPPDFRGIQNLLKETLKNVEKSKATLIT